MKAEELIKQLQQIPPNSDVVVWSSNGEYVQSELHLVEYRGNWLLEWDGINA